MRVTKNTDASLDHRAPGAKQEPARPGTTATEIEGVPNRSARPRPEHAAGRGRFEEFAAQ